MNKILSLLCAICFSLMVYSQNSGFQTQSSGQKNALVKKALLATPVGNLLISGNATLKVFADASLTVKDAITNLGNRDQMVVLNGANLIQLNDAALNSGAITSESDFKIGNARTQYNYLGSPVAFEAGQSYKTVFPGSNNTVVLYHNQTSNTFSASSGANVPGRGSAVKEPPTTTGLTSENKTTAQFKGTPQNGEIIFPIANRDIVATTYGYNLIGNPYPSNIDLIKLYELNGGKPAENPQVESPIISATFYFWDNTGNTVFQQQGSGYGGQSYAIFNVLTGSNGTGTKAGSLSNSVTGTKIPTRTVKVGQGFMTKSKVTSNNFIFNNSVRTDWSATTSFLGTGRGISTSEDDRYWLRMTAPSGIATTLAVVYYAGGNDAFGAEDSRTMGGSDALFSLIDTEKAAINGRSAFRDTDKIPLGSTHFTAGSYTIGIETPEGIFRKGQSVYLKDRSSGIITNLTKGDYSFTEQNGETARFEVVYKPESVLATDAAVKEEIVIYRDGSDFVAEANSKKITRLDVYDMSGRQILALQPNATKVVISGAQLTTGVYMLKIDQNGTLSSRKIIK